MKVIFNIEPIMYPLTGIGRYTYELARIFLDLELIHNLVFWKWTRVCDNVPSLEEVSQVAGDDGRESIVELLKKFVANNSFAMDVAVRVKNSLTSLNLLKYKDYIYHGPNFYLPPFGGIKVVTVHDLSILAVPQHHPAARVKVMEKVLETARKKADFIITDSEFSKGEIVAKMGYPADKIKVTPLAAAAHFHPRDDAAMHPALKQYGLTPRSYCLFTGTLEPRKNIDFMLDVYEGLPAAVKKRFPLVIAGHEGWKSEGLRARLEKLSRSRWLKYIGFVSSAVQPLLTAGAALFLYPSLYEGFGLPPLEAMQCGVPALMSDRASLPEVAGDASLCLDPADVDIWRQKITAILEDTNLRQKLSQAAVHRASAFSWNRCALETLEAYREAAS